MTSSRYISEVSMTPARAGPQGDRSQVCVLDTNKQPLNPVHPGRARRLLTSGQAAVYHIQPFTIILKRSVSTPAVEPLRLKIDPGSKTTGLALVQDTTGRVVWAADL